MCAVPAGGRMQDRLDSEPAFNARPDDDRPGVEDVLDADRLPRRPGREDTAFATDDGRGWGRLLDNNRCSRREAEQNKVRNVSG